MCTRYIKCLLFIAFKIFLFLPVDFSSPYTSEATHMVDQWHSSPMYCLHVHVSLCVVGSG